MKKYSFIRSRLWLPLLALLMVGLLSACGGGETLTVLAGSELRDLEPLFDQIERNTDVKLEMKYIGTLDGAEALMAGEATDLAWFSHGKYITLLQGTSNRVAAQEKIMLSPVVMGVKTSKAQAFGWVDNANVTWRDVAAKAESGELRFAMTNPASSNSGFTALVGVAAAFAGGGDALQVEQIDDAAMKALFKGQTLTAGSSGWLAESYVREQATIDGMINYESVLLALNAGNELNEKLTLIYPKEGIITADYPLMLINADKREAYDKLVAYLRTPEFQQEIMERTLRRPVIPSVKLSSQFTSQLLIELPFPNNAQVIDSLLFAYLDEQRVPAHAFFVLDVSGSMEGDRLAQLKESLVNLTGIDQSLTGQFSRFRSRERITMIPFSSGVVDRRDFEINATDSQGQEMTAIRAYAEGLIANGGTAIFSSLSEAYAQVAAAQQQDPDRYYSIVLMSDGENTEGAELSDFLNYYQSLPAQVRGVRTFTILFGDSSVAEMEGIANATGGRVFDANEASLSSIFKQIRGYQ